MYLFQMNKNKIEICKFEMHLKNFFCLCSNPSNNDIISAYRPGARFSKVPVTFRARNQIFKSKYKE